MAAENESVTDEDIILEHEKEVRRFKNFLYTSNRKLKRKKRLSQRERKDLHKLVSVTEHGLKKRRSSY